MGITLLYDLLTSYRRTKNPWQKLLTKSCRILRLFPFSFFFAKEQHEKYLEKKSGLQNFNFVAKSCLAEKNSDEKRGGDKKLFNCKRAVQKI